MPFKCHVLTTVHNPHRCKWLKKCPINNNLMCHKSVTNVSLSATNDIKY